MLRKQEEMNGQPVTEMRATWFWRRPGPGLACELYNNNEQAWSQMHYYI